MGLKSSASPAPQIPPRFPLAWVVAIVLVSAAGAAVVAATLTSSPSASSGPLTITDDANRIVHLNPHPTRVVALGPNIVDALDHLGELSHLIGVDCYNGTTSGALSSDYTASQIARWSLTPSMCVEALPFVPSTLVNLTPDLVLASTIVSTAAVETVTAELGIPLVVLQPTTLGGILVDDLLLGEIFGTSAAANALNAQLTGTLSNASALVAGETTLPTVLVTYSVDSGGYWTYGPGSFGEALIEFCGGASIGAGTITSYPELSPAQVLAAQPQVIVYATGFGLGLSQYANGPDWTSFSAVQNHSLVGIDSTYLTEAGPSMILDGVPALTAAFFPGTI